MLPTDQRLALGRLEALDRLLGSDRAGDDSRVPSVILDLVPADGRRRAALWISLGAGGGRLRVSLARAWGFRGPTGKVVPRAETIVVPAGGHVWVSDAVPGDGIDVHVPAGRSAELCGLAPGRSGPAVA